MVITVGNVKEKLKDQVSSWEKASNLALGWKNYSHGCYPGYQQVNRVRSLPNIKHKQI